MPHNKNDWYGRSDQAGRLDLPHLDEGDEIRIEEYLLRRAVLDRAEIERQLREAVSEAVTKGVPWSRIGEILGVSSQSAQEQYGALAQRAS